MVETVQPEPRVFVVRLWEEPDGAGGGSKRGYVEHIASGRRCYFSELIDALEFIAALGAMPLTPRRDIRIGDDAGPVPPASA